MHQFVTHKTATMPLRPSTYPKTMKLPTILLLALTSGTTALSPTPTIQTTTAALSSLLLTSPPLTSAASDDDRPNAVYKINIHAQHSSDDSSDDADSEDSEGCLLRNPDKSCQIWNNVQHFRNDFGQLEFKWSSCDDPYDDSHDDFEEIHIENSLYQKIMFEENLIKEDKCLRLDTTLQQCSSYRPHYHEPFVHYSAAYLNSNFLSGVKRVVFVGGGDSMLLHEVLKYKGLEMVLGLELDQKVTRNSFEHFKTQPHFNNPKVQWWFGDGAKSLTLLPRSYFGTFDLVLLDLSETVMSMTVTKGLDVFGAMKLLLSDTGIMVKNDFGYFEKLSKVFDTCIQLLIPDVTYICDYELVLCGSDKIDFLSPTFDHLKGGKGPDQVETLVYKPLDDVEDHWGPVVDYSKYWGEPRKCDDKSGEETNAEEEVAFAGVLLVVEAENVSFDGLNDGDKVAKEIENIVKNLGYEVLSTTTRPKTGGAVVAVAMKEGYILAETWPDAKYCKLDIHVWGNFQKQEGIRSLLLDSLGVQAGDWSNYRIVTTGMRGLDVRAKDLETVGPDLAKIGQCEEVLPGSNKSILANSAYSDEPTLRPVIDAGYEVIISMMIRETESINAIVFCNVKGAPCRARDSIVQQGISNIVTMWSCSPSDEKELDSSAAKQGEFMQKWRQAIKENASEFSLCGKKTDVALREVATNMRGVNLVVVDAVAPSAHVTGCHQYYLKYWKTVKKPFLFLAPILDAKDQHRNFFLKSRYNHAEEEPEYYSEIFLGNGEKTMSFGLIHEGHSTSLQNFMRAETILKTRDEVKFAEIRKVTIRGAMRQQVDYEPKLFSWADYDQQPGLEQFYGQQPVGLQTVSQWGRDDASSGLSAAAVQAAIENTMKQFVAGASDQDSFHEIGQGALYIALLEKGQVVITWDGAKNMNVNIFTYDENMNHGSAIAEPIMKSIPKMNLMLRDEQPRGYGQVINMSNRINRDESPECYDHYKMCTTLQEAGNCSGANNADVWMTEHCRFSCGICGKNGSSVKSEL